MHEYTLWGRYYNLEPLKLGMRQTERRMFRMAFLLMARIRVRSAMRASIPLFYEQSAFCSSFSLELYIYKFISYTLLYIEETEVLSLHNRGFFW